MSRICVWGHTWPALAQFNAHIRHSPKLSPSPDGEEGDPFLEYVGNGHFGLAPPYASGASHWSDGDATDFGSEKSHDLHDASFYIRGGNQVVSPINAYFLYIWLRKRHDRGQSVRLAAHARLKLHTFQSKVCHEKNFQHSGAYISVGIHFTENLKVPAERPWICKLLIYDASL